MTIEDCKKINSLIIDHGHGQAATYVSKLLGKEKPYGNHDGLKMLQGLVQHLLDSEDYLKVATLQWGPTVFQVEPESVTRTFEAIRSSATSLIMGASSMSKSYSAGAWMLLDYLRDPLYTSVKLAAVSEDHLKKNLFAHVAYLFRSCSIPSRYPIIVQDAALWIGVKEAGNEFGVSGIAFKQSQETSGQFKGYKAKPVSSKPRGKFGTMSRLRVLLDEGQNVPGGPFQDFNSLIASKTGNDLIKIVCCFNPESLTCKVVELAEPDGGWSIDQVESLYDYEAKSGWRVCRLDAALCENVVQKKLIYPGLQTYEGFTSYLRAGGDNSASFMVFARGFPPLGGSVITVIPPMWPNQQRGEAVFVDTPTSVGAVDLAFTGRDTAKMAIGRWGLASGWRNQTGELIEFNDRQQLGKRQSRHVLQVDAILPLDKCDDTVKMAEQIMERARMMQIEPRNCSIDSTGIGFGTWSHLNRVWGDVMGINWSEKASEQKILSDDLKPASLVCDGVVSEMWWSLRQWLDPRVCAILFNPVIPTVPLFPQLIGRRYKNGRLGVKVEPKDEFKLRNQGHSPDEADALVMLVHVARKRSLTLPGLVDETQRKGFGERPELAVVGEISSIESHDSICPSGNDEY